MPSIGPVTAAAVVSAIDDVTRVRGAHEVEAYLGLVPRELSSGESHRRGRITKAGHTRVRWLLVQAAVSTLRLRDPRTVDLREWAMRIAARRGKKVAVVALARRMAGILSAMRRDATSYGPRGQNRAMTTKPVAAAEDSPRTPVAMTSGHQASRRVTTDVVGARMSAWPQSESRLVDGAPPRFDSLRAPTRGTSRRH
jgi:transposase IS116/IS110/IS902 family protein